MNFKSQGTQTLHSSFSKPHSQSYQNEIQQTESSNSAQQTRNKHTTEPIFVRMKKVAFLSAHLVPFSNWRPGLILSRNWEQLVLCFEGPASFFGILWIISTEISLKKKKLFVLMFANVKDEKFHIHSPHDSQSPSFLSQNYESIRVQLTLWRLRTHFTMEN